MRKEITTTKRGYNPDGTPIALGRFGTSRAATENPSSLDIAWAAGIYEGEGYCAFTSRHRDCIEACVTQKDRWLIDKFQRFFGGNVDLIKPRGKNAFNGGNAYRWRCSGARARGFLMTIYMFLSPRRQAQIQALEFMGTRREN